MKLATGWAELSADGRGFTARPAQVAGELPGILLIQEAFGVDGFIQDVAQRLARAGYAVMAPDLFSSGGTPPALAPDRIEAAKGFLDTQPPALWVDVAQRDAAVAKLPPGDRERMAETLTAMLPATRPWDQYLTMLQSGHRWLVEGPSHGRRVGALGFCLGGALALRLACIDPELGAAVSFYGMGPSFEALPGIRCPVLALYAERDPRILEGLPALREAMQRLGKSFEDHVYPGVNHAFFNDTRRSYDVGASRDAWARSLSFLAAHL